MWTPQARVKYDRRDLRYPSDLRNEEWVQLESLLPKWEGRGRPPEYPLHEIINSIHTLTEVPAQEAGLGLAEWLVRLCSWIEMFIVDGRYNKRFCGGVHGRLGWIVEVAEWPRQAKEFVVLPKRGKVEQTFGVLVQNRRLQMDNESLMINSLAMLTLASIFRLIISLAA